jgi:GGDEF domain-containing protein
LSRRIQEHCAPRRGFVGHVGGDDFVILSQSCDWEARCEHVVAGYNEAARQLYNDESRSRGGIEAEDRHGATRFFNFIRRYMGAVVFAGNPGRWRAVDVTNAAAMAKQRGLSVYMEGTGLLATSGQAQPL